MATFSEGQRVRVKVNSPSAPANLYGREGFVTFVGPPMAIQTRGAPSSAEERQYMVRFDGDGSAEGAWKSWLEPV